ncbi:MAG: carboxymuconolactone decarboxylase family protein [Candidatus Hadarchaeia archaeon]
MKDLVSDFQKTLKTLKEENEEAMAGFQKFMDATIKDNTLDQKTKELVTLGTAITARCKYCIALHTKNCLDAGASKDEIFEVAMVAIMMGGGPAFTYATEVLKSLEEFTE